MTEIIQVILVAVITTLTTILAIIGVQIIGILKEVRRAIENVNRASNEVFLSLQKAAQSFEGFSGVFMGVKTFFSLFGSIAKKLKKTRGDKQEEEK